MGFMIARTDTCQTAFCRLLIAGWLGSSIASIGVAAHAQGAARRSSAVAASPAHDAPNHCPEADAVRWVGSDPSTPLAAVVQHEISSAGVACCALWGRAGSHWKEVDAYGEVVSEAQLSSDSEAYDVTGCAEYTFHSKISRSAAGTGHAGVGLWFRGAWSPPPSARWLPTPAQQRSLFELAARLDPPVARSEAGCSSVPKSGASKHPVLFFTVDYRLEANRPRLLPFAVVGGPVLLLARLQSNGRWLASRMETFGSSDRCGDTVYRPRAVFDMNADGRPELIIHRDFGDSFDDMVLSLHPTQPGGNWSVVALGVHGATA